MKNIFTLLTMALLTLILFSGCNDSDASEARTLDGTWTGVIDSYYHDRWGLVGNTYRTTMYFHQLNRYGGIGYEVDYNVNSPYNDYYYCEFDWDVNYGEITIRYADSWNNVYIYDYQLYSDYFEGYMDDGTNRQIHFQLYYDSRFQWDPYRNYYDYGYAATRSILNNRCHANGEFAKDIK